MKYQLLGIASTAAAALISLYVRKRLAGVDVDKKRADANIELDAKAAAISLQTKKDVLDAQAEPVRIYKAALEKRELELKELREQDRAEREQYVKTLTAIQTAIEKIADDMSAHRTEEKDRAGALHGRLDKMSERLLVIETRLGMDS